MKYVLPIIGIPWMIILVLVSLPWCFWAMGQAAFGDWDAEDTLDAAPISRWLDYWESR